jgi:hypothetical protein
MSSVALAHWRSTRLRNLAEVDAQCENTISGSPLNQRLAEENIRGYVMLLSAHFQGFCRDLYTECTQIVSSKIRASLQALLQEQFTSKCALDHGNPNYHNLKQDFGRFGFKLNLAHAMPGNDIRLEHLSALNEWRNVAAHHGVVPPNGLPGLSDLRMWRDSCDTLAGSLDSVMYNQLRRLLRRVPWTPGGDP